MKAPLAPRGGRRLTPEEEELWRRVADTIEPLEPRRKVEPTIPPPPVAEAPPLPPKRIKGRVPPPLPPVAPPLAPTRPLDRHGLDGGWDKRLGKGQVAPDFTLDLHGANLEGAYQRLEHGLALALAQGARVVLLITGRARPAPGPMDRGSQRGAIRAKFLDWLVHGSHSSRIAAVRAAHPRHGGAGAVYIILKRGK